MTDREVQAEDLDSGEEDSSDVNKHLVRIYRMAM